jgi:hypothetical protein
MRITADKLASDDRAGPGVQSAFQRALYAVARVLDVVADDKPMNISTFKASYNQLLERAPFAVQRIRRGKQMYVLLTEDQLIALASNAHRTTSLADTLADIPAPPMPLSLAGLHTAAPRHEQFSMAKLRD